jgi:hypothetical protein
LEDRLSLALADDERVTAARLAMATAFQPNAAPIAAAGAAAAYTERAGDLEPLPESTGLPPSESTNVWPDEAAEASFISETRGRGETVHVAAAPVAPTEDVKEPPMPKLDELVQRIPDSTRDLLDELFRAKFVAVRRVPKELLKS